MAVVPKYPERPARSARRGCRAQLRCLDARPTSCRAGASATGSRARQPAAVGRSPCGRRRQLSPCSGMSRGRAGQSGEGFGERQAGVIGRRRGGRAGSASGAASGPKGIGGGKDARRVGHRRRRVSASILVDARETCARDLHETLPLVTIGRQQPRECIQQGHGSMVMSSGTRSSNVYSTESPGARPGCRRSPRRCRRAGRRASQGRAL